jgi:hypothetical protein
MNVDISEMNDLKELKALAYDQFLMLEQAKVNLQVVENRIQTVKEQARKKENEANAEGGETAEG